MSKEFKRKASKEVAEDSLSDRKGPMAFSDWFVFRLKTSKRLQAHHYDSILAFFKHKGLSEQESPKEYDSALKIFGF